MADTEKKAATRKFLVIKKNTLDFKKGQIVQLTKNQSVALVGKVRLYSSVEADAATENASKELAEENAALKAELAALKKAK
jgi:hypothetical protein